MDKKMTLLLFLLLATADVSWSVSQNCVLIVGEPVTSEISGYTQNVTEELQVRLIFVEQAIDTVASLISTALLLPGSCDARICTKTAACDQIIGVVGDIDSEMTRTVHTIASRSNLTVTMVAVAASSTFLTWPSLMS